MSYYKIFGLEKEPFSTSPDPDFLYHAQGHNTALKRLEIAIRLHRGLSVILGDVGTGKTTLARKLLQVFQDENDFIFHMILDPGFKSEFQFLLYLVKIFNIMPICKSTLDFKEAIERYLFQKGVEENKTIVLIIDEGQKINLENLEVLRTLLNFETNESKLLQLVILAQVELLPRIKRINNFMERIALKYTLNPLDENETKEMIEFRLRQAGYSHQGPLFSAEAIKLIYQNTLGLPRRIAKICHEALLTAVMKDSAFVDAEMINNIVFQEALSI
jgi:general secretion pathway protein A